MRCAVCCARSMCFRGRLRSATIAINRSTSAPSATTDIVYAVAASPKCSDESSEYVRTLAYVLERAFLRQTIRRDGRCGRWARDNPEARAMHKGRAERPANSALG
jgi:hypothetical protein